MKFCDKINAYKELARGEKNAPIPKLYSLLWKLGFKEPPPVFSSFIRNTVIISSLFALIEFTFTFIIILLFLGQELAFSLLSFWVGKAVILGLLVGIGASASYKSKKNKLVLPSWDDFPER